MGNQQFALIKFRDDLYVSMEVEFMGSFERNYYCYVRKSKGVVDGQRGVISIHDAARKFHLDYDIFNLEGNVSEHKQTGGNHYFRCSTSLLEFEIYVGSKDYCRNQGITPFFDK